VLILRQMARIGWQQGPKQVMFTFSHSLNQESPIMTKEEKTSTFTSAPTRLENLLSVELRGQRFLQQVQSEVVLGKDRLKVYWVVVCYLDSGSNKILSLLGSVYGFVRLYLYGGA